MSHQLTLWIKKIKKISVNNISVLSHLSLAWILSYKDKASSLILSPKAEFIMLEGEKRLIVQLLSFNFLEKNKLGMATCNLSC